MGVQSISESETFAYNVVCNLIVRAMVDYQTCIQGLG